MKKSALGFAILVLVSSSLAHAVDLQSIRILRTSDQFSEAVGAGKVFVDFAHAIPLRRNGADVSSTYVEKVMTTKNPDNTNRVLTMACSLHLHSKARRARISSTVNQTRKWQVTETKRVGHAELLTLKKPGSPALEIMCYSHELDQSTGERREVPMTASMIDRVLSEKGGRVKTAIQPEEFLFANESMNLGLARPSQSVPVVQ